MLKGAAVVVVVGADTCCCGWVGCDVGGMDIFLIFIKVELVSIVFHAKGPGFDSHLAKLHILYILHILLMYIIQFVCLHQSK